MLTLLAKDWRASRFYVGLIVPWYLLMISQAALLPAGLVELSLPLVWMVALAPAILELVNGCEPTFCSMPVTRPKLVAGRYLFAVSGCGFALLLCLAHIKLLQGLGLPGVNAYGWLPTVEGATAFLASALVLLGVLLPLTFGFGLIRGVLAFFGLICLALALQVILLWGEPVSSWRLGSPLQSLTLALTRRPFGLLLLWALMSSGLLASCWIAGRLYRRRDL